MQTVIACSCAAEYMCHVYVRSDGLSSVLISDLEYPQRVAFSLLNKVCTDIFFGVIFLTNALETAFTLMPTNVL